MSTGTVALILVICLMVFLGWRGFSRAVDDYFKSG